MFFLRKVLPRSVKKVLKEVWYGRIKTSLYPSAPELDYPLNDWKVNDVGFLKDQREIYGTDEYREHLGEDCVIKPGTPVFAIGRGKVVYSALHSTDREPEQEGGPGSNWGNVIIIGHGGRKLGRPFWSLYGHLAERRVKLGDRVKLGEEIGEVAEGWTSENGWWKQAHLHLAIYTGSWRGEVLPGTYRDGERTKKELWEPPTEFIDNYNQRKEG